MQTKTTHKTTIIITGRYSKNHFNVDVISRNGSYSTIVSVEDLIEGSIEGAKERFPHKGSTPKFEAPEMNISHEIKEKIKKKLAKKQKQTQTKSNQSKKESKRRAVSTKGS